MLRTVLSILFVFCFSIGAGAASVWYALNTDAGVGGARIGAWAASPTSRAGEADPYARARIARIGKLTLGAAEGVTFSATHDTAGQPLRRECAYTLSGTVPAARFWTLYAAEPAGAPILPEGGRAAALPSDQLLYDPRGATITAAAGPRPGNWLALDGQGPFVFVLTLYDAPAATGDLAGIASLPRIVRGDCSA